LNTAELLRQHRSSILEIAARHGARDVRIFGSAARGDSGPDSDVDLLVDMDPNSGLLDLCAVWVELRDLLGRNVDLVTESSLHWVLRRKILKEARPL
jgi:hypothetical protein